MTSTNQSQGILLASHFIKLFHPWLWSKRYSRISKPDNPLVKSLIVQAVGLLDKGTEYDAAVQAINEAKKAGVSLQHITQVSCHMCVKANPPKHSLLTGQAEIVHTFAFNGAVLKDTLSAEDIFKYANGIFDFVNDKKMQESVDRLVKNYGLDQVLFAIDILSEKGECVTKPIFLRKYFEDATQRIKHTKALRLGAKASFSTGGVDAGDSRQRYSWGN
jgi:hypothetical protein